MIVSFTGWQSLQYNDQISGVPFRQHSAFLERPDLAHFFDPLKTMRKYSKLLTTTKTDLTYRSSEQVRRHDQLLDCCSDLRNEIHDGSLFVWSRSKIGVALDQSLKKEANCRNILQITKLISYLR